MAWEQGDAPEESRRNAPQCEHCGETVQFNRIKALYPRPPSSRYPQGVPKGGTVEGWSHWHGMKMSHEATPPPGVSGESYLTAHQAKMDQAKMHVRKVLQSNFDYLHAEQAVNRLFHDRREGNGA